LSPQELEFKAKLIWTIWRAVDKRLRVNSFTSPWARLTPSLKDDFRKLARSRRFAAVETAWRSRKRKRANAMTRSPYREAGLIGTAARGQGQKRG